MQNEIDEQTFIKFYLSTVLNYSVAMKTAICKKMEEEGKITFETQMTLGDNETFPMYFQDKKDVDEIIRQTTLNKNFSNFYENWEFIKLYKYSVPFFFDSKTKNALSVLNENKIKKFDEDTYRSNRILPTEIGSETPIYKEIKNGEYVIKFVLQKSYPDVDTMEQVDYRYPVVIYLNSNRNFLEIRYDSVKYGRKYTSNVYEDIVEECIGWLENTLDFNLFEINHNGTINNLKNGNNDPVKIYKQMMELSSGGSAELTAAKDQDYLLPFIDEIRELINENDQLFKGALEVKNLIEQYLDDKEATANYPYIYVSWGNAVASQSYIVKITFDYLQHRHTLLQHLTGTCTDLEMERMNNAIEYLCKSGSFVKGTKV
ncbi:hypothetical protein J2Z60_001275 [Lactobacillus colini]|uniref:Uncharacterized protein n=1 Tax=Lactobacillus colini TaxID=1819254 RepID=A0ABS4MEI5_9LACO|nr:hypothetical protein [Lactobacillus colini]MBP2058098.1 hypothetical protein [Lactobacillus colini]